ncbi:MAG: S41 family peptidase, partial [Candidatus Omnitrophica bacterium]|nr:S41 family peptidase [Candidatus Omnitrophota bacterium]
MNKKILFFLGFLAVLTAVSALALSDTRKKKDDLYNQVSLFSGALAIIQEDYVDEVTSKDLIYGALKGMLSSLDPHSQFMDPDTYEELKVNTEGKFGGLGIEITIKDGLLTVIAPIDGTPAWEVGIKANDRIIKIDNEVTRDITITDAVKKLRGEPGTSVNLTVLREPDNKILEFKITRQIIKIRSVKNAQILEDGIAYIQLVEFGENTPKDLDYALNDLMKKGMSALVLDLRNNPGGLLDIAVKVAEKFVEKGKLIVYTKGRKEQQSLSFESSCARPVLDLP